MILPSLKGGHPNEQGDDFDGEFTGWAETSHLRGKCGSETDSTADRWEGRGERALHSRLMSSIPLRHHLSVHLGDRHDSPCGTVPGHPHLLLCAEEEEAVT